MKQVHFTLQGKGGVGKSFVSSLIAQHYQAAQQSLVALDADPVNSTLKGYESLNVTPLILMEGNTLIERNFDQMMERILAEDSNFLIDNGASSFIPLMNYLIENDAIGMITAAGKTAVVHTVLVGGQSMADTLKGFQSVVTQLPEAAKLIVWLNEYDGPIEHEGTGFQAMKVYTANKDRVSGIIRIPQQTSSTFGKDMTMMLQARMTFADVAAGDEFGIMSKQRLASMRRTIFDQMGVVL